MKRTPWYPVSINPMPERPGFYEVQCGISNTWGRYTKVYWTGRGWRYLQFDPANVQPCDFWRGLTKEHK